MLISEFRHTVICDGNELSVFLLKILFELQFELQFKLLSAHLERNLHPNKLTFLVDWVVCR